MLPGVLEGLYSPSAAEIDVAALTAAIPGGRMLLGRATAVDAAAREVVVEEDGRSGTSTRLPFDVLSLDVGASPGFGGVPGAQQWATPVKPVATFLERVGRVVEGAAASSSFTVVGGGAGGVEVAAALAARAGGSVSVTLVCGGSLLPGAPAAAVSAVEARLAAAGVRVLPEARVARVDGGGGSGVTLTLSVGPALTASACLWCTGAAAPGWLGAGPAPLPLTADGFVAVGADLACSENPSIFAAGDCAAVLPHPRPKAGVFAVRQGPPLSENLLAALEGCPPRPFTPRAQALSIISLGGRTAVAIVPVPWREEPVVLQGAWAWRWKDAIDRAFMRRYRV